MNADTIARRIVEDARKAAQEAVDAANARAEEARKAAAAEVEKKREAALARADEDAARQRENALRMAELDQRKALLAMKREMIDSAFAQALEALIAMPVEQARAVNMRLLLDAAEGEMELVVAQADEAIFSAEFLAEANRNLAAKGARVRLAAQRKPARGGFILRRGGMEISCEYAALVARVRPLWETDVAQMLFQ